MESGEVDFDTSPKLSTVTDDLYIYSRRWKNTERESRKVRCLSITEDPTPASAQKPSEIGMKPRVLIGRNLREVASAAMSSRGSLRTPINRQITGRFGLLVFIVACIHFRMV